MSIELSEEEILLIKEKRKKEEKKQKEAKKKSEEILKKYGPLVTEIEKSEEFKNMKFEFSSSYSWAAYPKMIIARCNGDIVITYSPDRGDERKFSVVDCRSGCNIPKFGNNLQSIAYSEFKELSELKSGDYAIKISKENYESGFDYSHELVEVSHVCFFKVSEYKNFLESKDTNDRFRDVMSVNFGKNLKIDVLIERDSGGKVIAETDRIKNKTKNHVFLFGHAAKKFIKDIENIDYFEDADGVIHKYFDLGADVDGTMLKYFNSDIQMEFSFIQE